MGTPVRVGGVPDFAAASGNNEMGDTGMVFGVTHSNEIGDAHYYYIKKNSTFALVSNAIPK